MIYADDLDEKVMKQWESAIDQPFVVSSALMADAHLGYTLPIGGVVSTKDYIVPSWVGYDIGCGVLAIPIKADIDKIREKGEDIYKEVLKVVPVGYNHRKHRNQREFQLRSALSTDEVKGIWDKKGGTKQMGTLGGGNHFIEIGHSGTQAYIIIHSGSRGIGHGIASHYIRMAHPEGKLGEGSYTLKVNTFAGEWYLNDMEVCEEFAYHNRLLMFKLVVKSIEKVLGEEVTYDVFESINKTHNHVKYRGDTYIHRKGATEARKGEYGVIPGNMMDGSYIVKGLGNPESLYSASHGAGRKYGRKAAKRELSLEEFSRDMSGITAKVNASTLDESPSAYKNIAKVLTLQKDLVEVVDLVRPIINIKG